MTWLTTLITDSSWQDFMSCPSRQRDISVFFWCIPITLCGCLGAPPTLPAVFVLTALSFTDPACIGDPVMSLVKPVVYSPCTSDIIIDSIDCNMEASTEPYYDVHPYWILKKGFFLSICWCLGAPPTLPAVLIVSALTFTDPAYIVDPFMNLVKPVVYSPFTSDIIIESIDCNMEASTEPYSVVDPY